LKARYQNEKVLVFAAIAKIIDHKPIDGSSRQLRALHDTIKNTMSTLKNLDVSTKSWDPILCFLIRRKLDQQSLAALENIADAPKEIPTLRSVLTFVERRACMLEMISAQPTATAHNEESCKICHLGQHKHAQIVCLQLIRLKTVDHRPLFESANNGIIHGYTKDRLAIQWPAQ